MQFTTRCFIEDLTEKQTLPSSDSSCFILDDAMNHDGQLELVFYVKSE